MTISTGFRVETFQYGQEIRDDKGAPSIMTADMVQVALVLDGRTLGAGVLSPEDAVRLAGQIITAASDLRAAQIDDTGKPASLLSRLFGARA